MLTTLQKTEQGMTIVLPAETLDALRLTAGSEVSITLNPEQSQIIITPVAAGEMPGMNEEFARQVADFIEQYRPALEALAR